MNLQKGFRVSLFIGAFAIWGGCSSSPVNASSNFQDSGAVSYRWVSPVEVKATAVGQQKAIQPKGPFSEGDVPASEVVDEDFRRIQIEKTQVSLGDLAMKGPRRVVVIGDTGCRLKEWPGGGVYQECSEPTRWPFPELMKQIAENEKADLVIHVGDFLYREKCSTPACHQLTPVWGYGWKSWEADFFSPARAALEKAPWVFVRGNHEDCRRAFQGYKSLLARQEWKRDCVIAEETEYVQLGDLLLVNYDSSAVDDKPISNPEIEKAEIQRLQMVEAEIVRRKAKEVWFLTHKPFFGFLMGKDRTVATNVNLSNWIQKTGLLQKVHLFLAGHIHNSQVVQFHPSSSTSTTADLRAVQIVVGHSGTGLEPESSLSHLRDLPELGYSVVRSDTKNAQSFGYAVIERPNGESASAKTKKKRKESAELESLLSLRNLKREETLSCHIHGLAGRRELQCKSGVAENGKAGD